MTDHRLRARLIAALLAVALLPAVPAGASVAVEPQAEPRAEPLMGAAPSPYATTLAAPVAPGVDRSRGTWTTADGIQVVELVRADPAAPGIVIDTSRPAAGVSRLETVRSQAARVSRDGHRVVAAVNGDVWMTDDATGTHAPIGVQVHDGELLTGTHTEHPTLGLDRAEVPRLGDVAVTGSVLLPGAVAPLVVDRVNKPRRTGDLVVYSRRWAARTGTLAGGAEVILAVGALPLRPAGSWTGTVTAVVPSAGDTAIPAGGLVLSAQGADADALRALRTGAVVTLDLAITPGWEAVTEAIGGREWLVEAGATSVRPASGVTSADHPRTAVGIDAEGRLLLATVDGRWPGYSVGVTASDLAGLMAEQGAVEAIMLDGGGSTTALSRRPGALEARVVNRPSDGRERPVDNALLVISTTPTGPLADIVVRPPDLRLVVGQATTLVAKGVDAALNGVPLGATAVAWSAEGDGASLAPDGRVRATTPGAVTVTAAAAGHDATGRVTVTADTVAPVAATPVVRARTGGTVEAGLVPVTITWSATDTGTGVASYEVRRRFDGGYLEAVPLPAPLTTSLSVTLPVDRAVQVQVRATDRAGNTGEWSSAGGFHLRLASERSSAVSYRGRWTARTGAGYLGGTSRSSASSGATASFTFTGRGIAWIGATGPTRGRARVYVDGSYVATVDLRGTGTALRRVAWTRTWTSVATRRVTIRVLGTPGRPRVDVDGFAIVDAASPYPVLVGAGDIASCGYTADSATASLIARIPGTVFAAGDIAYERGTTAQLNDCYHPTWGRFRSRTRPVPGNHDYYSSGAAPYFAYFGARAGTAGQGWYAYDVGTWRVYALNSNCAAIGGCGADTAQLRWLAEDLAANPRACVAAVWHHPLFSSGLHGASAGMRAAWDVLEAAGADLVLNGHDHDYERFAPQLADGTASPAGIRQFVVGTGGAGLRSWGTVMPNSEVRKTGVHGVLKLELMTGSYRWTFVPVAGSSWTDTGTAICH